MRSMILELQQKENDYKIRIDQLEKVVRQSATVAEVPQIEELER